MKNLIKSVPFVLILLLVAVPSIVCSKCMVKMADTMLLSTKSGCSCNGDFADIDTVDPLVPLDPGTYTEPDVGQEPVAEPVIPVYNRVNPYESITVTKQDEILLAKMAYGEARGECFEGQVAVIQVALNRCLHPKFPDTLSEVVYAKNQFFVADTYNDEQMNAVRAALAGVPVLDLNPDVVYFSTSNLSYGSYFCKIGNHIFRTYN